MSGPNKDFVTKVAKVIDKASELREQSYNSTGKTYMRTKQDCVVLAIKEIDESLMAMTDLLVAVLTACWNEANDLAKSVIDA